MGRGRPVLDHKGAHAVYGRFIIERHRGGSKNDRCRRIDRTELAADAFDASLKFRG
jgi:hypothetical protein